MLTGTEIMYEYTECLIDPVYAICTYLKTFDKTQEGFVPFKLFPKQIQIVEAYKKYRFTMITKPRQAGVSTTSAAYAATKAVFADPNNPEAILIIANKQEMAFEFLDKIKDFVSQYPRWVWGDEYYGTDEKEGKSIYLVESKKELKLPNGSRIKAVATSKDALRGFTPTWLIMDEAAFIDDGAIVFGAALTALGTGGRATLISTPNGMDALYHKTYEQSKKGKNDFHIIEMKWYQDPRYTTNQQTKVRDLIWIHEEDDNDVIEELKYLNYGDSEESVLEIYTHYENMVNKGYKPSSSWYREMCRGMNNDKKMIAQELDVSFIGSGGNVIDDKYIIMQERLNVCEPLYTAGDKDEIWIWEEPIEGHEYILIADVARGDGGDNSTIVVIDFTTMTQVMEYEGQLQPDLLGTLVDEYARIYEALVVVDVTGGWGVGTITQCQYLGTPNLYYDETSAKPLEKVTNKSPKEGNIGKYPGFNCTAGRRAPIVRNLEKMIRLNAIKVRSKRMISEMRTFVFKNGRADHMDGYHDDLLMPLAYGLWVMETSFKKLKEAKAKTKAMLAGWIRNDGRVINDDDLKRNGFVSKNDRKKKVTSKKPNFTSQVSKNMQDPKGNYMWLFSGSK
tara:strand:- start:8041 stop:9897 length:1857 start_codon:yes stop_codon:yes gene_type:complete